MTNVTTGIAVHVRTFGEGQTLKSQDRGHSYSVKKEPVGSYEISVLL